MSRVVIVGAGLSGLIAASMLRGQLDSILEGQSSLPNNHAALLRFRSSVVGDATGIPFRPVKVAKAIHSPTNPVRDMIDYSVKTTGTPGLRSIVSASGEIEERFIAPRDFIERLGEQSAGKIAFDVYFRPGEVGGKPVISTIPLPVLAGLLGYEDPALGTFAHRSGWVISATLSGVDVCATLYYPRSSALPYRASITGDRLIIEGTGNEEVSRRNPNQIAWDCASDLGVQNYLDPQEAEFKSQQYAKILPINSDARKRFILWASERHNIYSLGRFATWRPGLLLDDIVNDVRVIQRMINGDSSAPYSARK